MIPAVDGAGGGAFCGWESKRDVLAKEHGARLGTSTGKLAMGIGTKLAGVSRCHHRSEPISWGDAEWGLCLNQFFRWKQDRMGLSVLVNL